VDAPQVSVGQDTVVSLGQTLSFLPVVAPQEFGVVVQFKVDFDGNLTWDDSSATLKTVSYKFDVEKEYSVRFYVRDTEGNQTIVIKKVRAVKGPVVAIVSPANNSYSRIAVIAVKWTVNDVEQDSLKSATLKDGANTITRTVKDAAGTPFSSSITVTLDSLAPNKPVVVGSSPTSANPKWTWTSGGQGGSGDYRFHLGAEPTAADTETRLLEYSNTTPTSGQTYTLYVQERDASVNWSQSSSLPIKYDLTKPTVAILQPQASGTFISNVDGTTIIVVSGTATPNPPNTISSVTYSLDGGAQLATVAGANGAWSFNVTLPTEKTYSIKVTGTDNLGNAAEALLSILRDHTGPPAPKIETNPPSPVNSTTGTWTWSQVAETIPPGSGSNGHFRYSLNGGTTWTETDLLAVTITALKEGPQTFSLQQQDKAGNWSVSATNGVTIDTKAPDAVTFVGSDGSYTDTQTPTWTWTPSAINGGIAAYVLKVDAGAEFDFAGTSYTSTAMLSDNATHTLTVKQKDQVPGVVGAAKSFSFNIKANPAAAPFVKSAANVAPNGLTNNPKFSWASGGGGNGIFRYRVNGESEYHSISTPPNEFSVPSGPDEFYTLRISEQDVLNRWGPEGIFTIDLDRTAPDVAITSPDDGFITNQGTVSINYTVDGGASKSVACNLNDNQETTCSLPPISDAAGNTGITPTRKVWMRSNVVFVKAGTNGNGTSWDDPSNFSATLEKYKNDNKEIWVAAGSHSSTANFVIGGRNKVYGGFAATGYPNARSQRNSVLNKTTLEWPVNMTGAVGTSDCVVDGFIMPYVSIAGEATLANSEITKTGGNSRLAIDGYGQIRVENISIVGANTTLAAVLITGHVNVEFAGGTISNNQNKSGLSNGEAMEVGTDGSVVLSNGLQMSGNYSGTKKSQISLNTGSLTVKSGVVIEGGKDGIYVNGGTLIYE